MPRPTSAANGKEIVRVAIITLDNHVASAVARANLALQAQAAPVEVSLHAAAEWGIDGAALTACHEAIANADIIIATMLFIDEHIQAVLPQLQARRDDCDAMICCMCSGDVVRLTRIGNFDMSKADGPAKAFFRRLRKSGKSSKAGSSGAKQMAMLRRIPKILRFIPGTAQDVRAYFLVLQYWLAGSDTNSLNMIRMVVDRYASGPRQHLRGSFQYDAPKEYLETGLYHPALPDRMVDNVDALLTCANPKTAKKSAPRVGLLVMRSYVLAGNTRHYDAVIDALETRGYQVITAFASGLDAQPAIEQYFQCDGKATIDLLLSLTGFSLVGGPAYNDTDAAQAVLTQLDVPYIAAHGIEFQTLETWQDSERGLLPVESAIMVAIPELDGATGTMLYAGRSEAASPDGGAFDMFPKVDRVEMLCNRIDKLIRLRRTERDARRLAIVIFNFPPNAGATGTAAYLAVFESLLNTLRVLAEQGYQVDVPENVDALRDRLLNGNAERYGAEANVHAHIDIDDHVEREPYLEDIEAAWGPAPGKHQTDGRSIHVLGETFGNVLVAVQPGFGYEGDPMRLLFEKGFAPTHAFSAFYRYLREDYAADAVLHFGTHGALEFMPGKQSGMSGECWPDRLIADLPNFYLYAANNVSEGTIAKRRSAATLISYLTPPITQAGLYRGLTDLKTTIDRWRTLPPGDDEARRQLSELIQLQANELDFDMAQPTSTGDADRYVDALRAEVHELEQTLIPHGLHVIGEPVSSAERGDLMRALLSVEQPDADGGDAVIASIVAGRSIADVSAVESSVDSALVKKLWAMNQALSRDYELDAVIAALDGGFVPPVVGGDLLRAPEILPTGRNLHGFDPYRMPSAYAMRSGVIEADKLLQRHVNEGHAFPESIAMVLWGTDNLKSEGGPIAQVLALMGAEPRFDAYGRLAGATLIPLAQLGRPRVDVVMSLSGIFRDLLPLQIKLLAEAAWLAASAEDEPLEQNFIRKNALKYQAEQGVDLETAALRVFSNADGAYGANVNQMIDGGTWSEEDELADVFTKRKSFAYDRAGAPAQQAELFKGLLSGVELAYQNLESVELGVTSVDHYFDTLGGISRSVRRAQHVDAALPVYIGDQTQGEAKVRTLAEQVALETRTRVLNPKWYEEMLQHGYEGVRHIECHVTNTVGWSATTGHVAPWVYQQLANTFMLDETMRNRLADLNPKSSMRVASRLLEAHERNYWQPDEHTLAALQAAGEDLEDRLEGIFEGVAA